MNDWEARARAIADPFERRLFVTGVFSEALAMEGVRAVVVGGTAVEWYTQGLYHSADVDLLCPTEPLDRVLRAMGFQREGRHWWRPDLNILVEAPGIQLDAYRDRTVTVEVAGVHVTMLAVEEAILDRLRACVHWASAADGEQALQMMVIHRATLDWPYLERRSVRDQVEAKLRELRKRAEDV